jgi:hypothetical protein
MSSRILKSTFLSNYYFLTGLYKKSRRHSDPPNPDPKLSPPPTPPPSKSAPLPTSSSQLASEQSSKLINPNSDVKPIVSAVKTKLDALQMKAHIFATDQGSSLVPVPPNKASSSGGRPAGKPTGAAKKSLGEIKNKLVFDSLFSFRLNALTTVRNVRLKAALNKAHTI